MSDSSFDHEREALAFLRRSLPDSDPIRVWANFEFVARTGAMYEVDAFAVTAAGVYLIEIKSYPGEISGDAGTWKWTRPDSSFTTFDNPRLLANRKAKHLADLLSRTDAYRKAKERVPFVQEVIFLSDPELRVRLAPQGRFHVYGRDAEDGEEIPKYRGQIGGIIEEITRLGIRRDGTLDRRIDRPMSNLIARAMNEIGIRERSSRRRVGDYRLGELLADVEADHDTGITYQDFVATHVAVPQVQRRIRIYPLEINATADRRKTAERAARREFSLLHQLDHPGILRPLDFSETDRGPALIFEHDPEELPLHRWLKQPEIQQSLSIPDRLRLTRGIAEALKSAHQRGITHRAISPSAVLVRGPADEPVVRITNWHTGARTSTGDTSTPGTSGTSHLEALAAHDAAFYRAPEFGQPKARPILLDVFSLGALATLIFTDRPPAETQSAYDQMLLDAGHIPADVIGDGLDQWISELIERATAADPAKRTDTIAQFLEDLDIVEGLWSLDKGPTEPAPDDARRGDTLGDGRFLVGNRLGKGSTAIALTVEDLENEGRKAVLKIAVDPSHNNRLEAEAKAIDQLIHRNVVRLLDGPIDIGGRTALLLSHAGSTTLAARMADQPLAELAERFGEDLLEAVRHLEQQGVSHRDIKPENIGITAMGANDELHLVLFDFSLANTPLEQISAGTQGYIDPFLKVKGRQSWDLHAERYAAAVTLFEMLTGSKPVYGDGSADPAMTDAPPSIDSSLFEPSIAPGLVEFFSKALARDASSRFDTADEMLRAWKRAFEPASEPATATYHPPASAVPEDSELVVPAGTTEQTPLAGLPLSNRAVNALEREEVLSVGDLLDFPLSRLPQIRGVGAKTRREISAAVVELRGHFESRGEDKSPQAPAAQSLVELSELLVPKKSRRDGETQANALTGFLGLDETSDEWPTQTQLAKRADVTRARISQIITAARSRWIRQPEITEIREWIAEELESVGGVTSAELLVSRLSETRRDDTVDRAVLRTAARAVIRAAIATEDEREDPRWIIRRRGSGTIVASERHHAATGQTLADYATALSEQAGALTTKSPVVGRGELLAALIAVDAPGEGVPIPESHLVDLAVDLTDNVALNSRLEMYRVGMTAEEAFRHSRRALVALREASAHQLKDKIRSRFPLADPIPDRPQLDELVGSYLDLIWQDDAQAYVAPDQEQATSSTVTSFRRHSTGTPTDLHPVEIDIAAEFEARLEKTIDSGQLRVLVTEPSRLEDVAVELERFPISVFDFDQLLIDALNHITADGRPSWEVLTSADAAGPHTTEWAKLKRVVDRALRQVTEEIFERSGTVLLHRLGLLGRYDSLHQVAAWREKLQQRDGQLQSLWLVVGTPHSEAMPALDGKAVPVLAGEWTRVPREWLENAHRAGVAS